MKSCKELHREKFQEMLEWWSLENLCTVMLCDSAFLNNVITGVSLGSIYAIIALG